MLPADIRPEHVMAARRELARRSLADFACMVDIPTVPLTDEADEDRFSVMRLDTLAAHHRLLCDRLQDVEVGLIPNLMVLMPPGSAKALALDTPIPTPDGWKSMGELRVGDRVFGDDGRPCNVTWVSPTWRDRPVYRVRTDCGDVITADRDHEWLVRLCGKRQVFKIKETHELARARSKRPMIRRAGALDLPEAELPIDPYLLGVWLGDGHSAGMRITSSVEDQPWLRGELERLGFTTKDSSQPTLFGVSGVRAKFAALGLVHDPLHATIGRKHIPAAYLRASIAQRLALLQGLIDTDGTVCKRRGCATFCNTNRELAGQVRELVRSLGVKAGWSDGPAMLNGKCCGTAYRVSFYMRGAARMPRKAALCRDQYRTPDTYIDAQPAGTADTVCIEVDSPTHLFLCGRSMTPTHNSTYTDVVFVPWFMSRKPRRHVILASYASEIAEKQGRRARQLIGSRSFVNLTGRMLRSDNRAVHQWTLDNGSEFMAGGLLSGLTGNRAAMGLIDDPIRGREAAQSETIRQKTWDAYIDDFCSRLIPGAPQVMILTRWHEDDPAGRILPEGWDGESGWFDGRDGRRWFVVCLPAEADRADDPLGRKLGESLWPEWFKAGHWEPFKRFARTWGSLYQQKPKPQEGDIFQVGMLQTVEAIPAGRITWARGWDFAGSTDGDYTAGVKIGKFSDGRFIVADVEREQFLADKRDRLLRNTAAADGKDVRISIPQDPGQAGKSQVLYLTRELAGYSVHSSPESGDKVTRAEPFAAQVNVGNVLMLKGPWNQAFREELRAFPAGRYDDQVDGASRAFARLLGAPDPAPAGLQVRGL